MTINASEYQELINALLDYETELSDTELTFLTAMNGNSTFTQDQAEKINKIYDQFFEGLGEDFYDDLCDEIQKEM